MEERVDLLNVQVLKSTDTWPLWEVKIHILFASKELMDIVEGKETLEDQGSDPEKIKKMEDKRCQS